MTNVSISSSAIAPITTRRLFVQAYRDYRRFGSLSLWLCFRFLPALLMMCMSALVLSVGQARAMEAVDPGGVEAGHLLLRADGGASYVPALVQRSKVHFDISGMVARVTVEQSFRNDSRQFMEGVYAFPLPEAAVVRYMEMVIGDRRIVGKIREREEAKKIYQAAKKAGKKASLVEQQRPNLFTSRVANIAPGEEVTVHLEYVQAVSFEGGTFSLRFPTTITPRYMPGSPRAELDSEPEGALVAHPHHGWATSTNAVPDAPAISPLLHPIVGSDDTPLNPVEITVELDAGMPLANVESPYHDISLSRRSGVYSIGLVGGVSEMDRDFVLSWQPVTGSAPRAALFTEEVGGQYYGLLMVVPPVATRVSAAGSREIIFVVDTSGSMGGVSIEQAKASLSNALARLQPADFFNIIEFDSSHRALYRNPMPATRHHLQQASEFVRLLNASGGTEMLPALRSALARPADADLAGAGASLRQVVFITDGAIGNEAALFEEIAGTIGESRLFTVGIGSAPNSWFMRKAAQFGRGTHTYISDLNEVGERMDALFEQLSRPAMIDVNVQWPTGVDAWPQRVPDLYYGQPLSLAVSFGDQPPAGEIVVTGDIQGREWRQPVQLASSGPSSNGYSHDGVASLWARRKIAGLLDQRAMGVDQSIVRAQVLPLALEHQLLSPFTSFVAVEEVVSRPPGARDDSAPVPNTRPRGQADQHFAYPQTATTGPAKAWFGMLALFCALILRMLRQPEAGSGRK